MFFTDDDWLRFLEGVTKQQVALLVPLVTEIHDRDQAILRNLIHQLREKMPKKGKRAK